MLVDHYASHLYYRAPDQLTSMAQCGTCNWPYRSATGCIQVQSYLSQRQCRKHTAQAGMPARLSLSHSEDMSGGASWPNTDAADITGIWVGASNPHLMHVSACACNPEV